MFREDGADGEVSIRYRTIDKTAVHSKDYYGTFEMDKVLKFKHGEAHHLIKIPIINQYHMKSELDVNFEVELFAPEGGATLGKIIRTAVTITNDDTFETVMKQVWGRMNTNIDSLIVYEETWAK